MKTILKEIDPLAFDEALKMTPQSRKIHSVKQDEKDRLEMDQKWDKINSKIKSNQPDFEEPQLPFKTSILIRDFNALYAKIYDKEKYIAA